MSLGDTRSTLGAFAGCLMDILNVFDCTRNVFGAARGLRLPIPVCRLPTACLVGTPSVFGGTPSVLFGGTRNVSVGAAYSVAR